MENNKVINDIVSSSENKEEKTVELPAIDFIKINLLSVILPLYVCLGIFLTFEYFIIRYFSIPLIFHFIASNKI